MTTVYQLADEPACRTLAVPFFAVLVLLFSFSSAATAQTGTISGTVTDAHTGEGLPGANVLIQNTLLGAASETDGSFAIDDVPVGTYTLRARFIGFEDAAQKVTVTANTTTTVHFELRAEPVGMTSITVSALRPDLQPKVSLEARGVRETNPRDSGELLRVLPGINAARRGPIGLDPNVRGLVETEVGAYVDGVRRFPAGPLRMDSQVSHFDPSTIDHIEVVKGPYALIWGGGNMSAIRVHTKTVSPAAGLAHGFARSSYDSNLNALGLSGAAFGSQDKVTYWVHGAYRQGDDYQSGNGTEIPADFTSSEVRGKVSYGLSPTSQVTVAGGYQDQHDIDYPGRLLDADFFHAADVSGRYNLSQPGKILRNLDALAYWHRVHHDMDNDDKPTRQAGMFPNGNPRPPLIIRVDSKMSNVGGRLAAELVPDNEWTFTVGGVVYSALRDATRPLYAVTPSGLIVPPFYVTDELWPDVRITDAGLFVNGKRTFGTVTASGTVRGDFVSSDA
ncbi:MAG: carboxypeptidase-like regulatory domain-containing protein, partial [Rhodothermales bacterium]